MRKIERLVVTGHAWKRWQSRIFPNTPAAEARARLEAFLAGAKIKTHPKTRFRMSAAGVPEGTQAAPGVTFIRNALLPGVEGVVEQEYVLTFQGRPRRGHEVAL